MWEKLIVAYSICSTDIFQDSREPLQSYNRMLAETGTQSRFDGVMSSKPVVWCHLFQIHWRKLVISRTGDSYELEEKSTE
jgi:hypothetical protein